jgi:hypothetical protein
LLPHGALPSFAGDRIAEYWPGLAVEMDIRDYVYRGQIVRTRFVLSNSRIVGKSSCWVTVRSGSHQFLTGKTTMEIEAKIDQALLDGGLLDLAE